MPKRLGQRLIVSLTIIVVVIELISGVIRVKTQEQQLLDAMILGADQLSRSITSSTWHAMLTDNRETAYQVMQTIALKQGIRRIRIFNREGRVMFSTAPGQWGRVDKNDASCAVCHSSKTPLEKLDPGSRSRIYREFDGERQLAMVTPIYNEPSCSQAECHAHPASVRVLGVLDVSLDLAPVDREVSVMEVQSVIVTGVQILLISLLIVFFTRRFVGRPIEKLIEGTRAVSAMDLDRPVKVNVSGEIGELAESFDTMRERLRQAIKEINDFTQSLESKVEERTRQLKVAHQKLLHSDRLASLGQLAASVAHEINNPLSGVLNLAMLMQRILRDDGIPKERVPEFKKYLSQVINETSRVGRIVSDLLAFSRRSKPQGTRADLNAIVATTLSLLSHKLKLSNVQVHFELEEKLGLVRCNSSQMQQVVINLVMNAAEATQTKGQGSLCIATRSDLPAGVAVLEVKDNGEGIPEENLSKIFDPFFTTKAEGKGIGLGLAVVYGIIDAHGGEIDVETKVGVGTTFRVTLPFAKEEEPAGMPSTGAVTGISM